MKAVKVLFIVGMLVVSGLFILPASNSGVASTPDVVAIDSDTIDAIPEDVSDADILEETVQGELSWHELPRDESPSAKLFLEHRTVAIDFTLPVINIEQTEDGEIISFEDCDFFMEKGMPLVPESRFFVAVPDCSRVTKVEVIEETVRQLDGRHMLAPYIPRTLDQKESPMQTVSYDSVNMFPSNTFDIKAPQMLRHVNALEVIVHPVRVRPATGIVQVTDSLRLSITLESDDGRKMASPSVPAGDRLDSTLLNSLFANPGDVSFSAPVPLPRAPSMINHTLNTNVPPLAIHPLDTTVGNIEGVSLLEDDDEDYYDAEAGTTMYMDEFDIGDADPVAILLDAELHLQYVGTSGYNGNSNVRWAVEGQALQDSSIQPGDLGGTESTDQTYNLLGHANSPVTVADIADLDIEFTENGAGAGSQDIPFDYIWVEFTCRQQLTGGSDYLIITSYAMVDELAPLAEWKTDRLGIDTQVYDTTWIDANWDGADLKERIHDFSVSMYENYSIEYILLAGDENAIPPDASYFDNYHANMNLGLYPEVAIGRLCTNSESDMGGMVNDIIAHQRDMRSWKKDMYLIGTNVFNTGDGKNDLLYVKNNYLGGHNLTFVEDYEVEGNVSRARTIDTYNAGMGNSIITGHGSWWGWYMNNGSQNFFNCNDVAISLTNADKRGFCWSSTCSSGDFIGGLCIGERWLTARNGGGIGYIGACELALYSSTMWLYRGFYRAYDQILDAGNEPTQGGCHFTSMHTNFYRIYVLFGDPQAGLTIMDPKMNLSTGILTPGFVEQKGFDQGEQVTFNTNVIYSPTILPEGVHVNLTVHNEIGTTYYPAEYFEEDPESADASVFLNWTVPVGAPAGIYNVTARIYNSTQGWEFVYENATYLFVDYKASVFSVEQVNAEVIEGDTVIYQVHIDNFVEPIPAGTVWVHLEGRNYNLYMTPFSFDSANITLIPTGLDNVIEVEVTVTQPGTFNVTAGLDINWAPMNAVAGNRTEVRGIRILDVTLNYPVFFRDDTANATYSYFAFTDFTGNVTLFIDNQTDQLYDPVDFYNGTGTFNFTWSVPDDLQNDTYDMELGICGLARNLELGFDPMRVVSIREILDKGESWLVSRQQADNGWQQRNESWCASNRNDTALAMQALVWSGIDPSDPVIQQAADYVNDTLNISSPGVVEDLAENIWALSDVGRGSTQKVQDAGVDVRIMQNWVYEPETWALWFFTDMGADWLVNATCYDDVGTPIYWEEYNGTHSMDWIPVWLNFTVVPDTAKLNLTINTTGFFIMERCYYPPFVNLEPWMGSWVDDFEGPGDGMPWNYYVTEEVEFDRGWGYTKGEQSLAKYTAWGVIGLNQASELGLGPFESESLATGVQWLLDNQNPNGSWNPAQWGKDYIENTALPVIALTMNGTSGQPIDDAVAWLETKQVQDGSYQTNWHSWGFHDNLISTSHTMRALRRAGYVFDDGPYIKEAARWLCAAQNETTGYWDDVNHYVDTATEAMLALAFLDHDYSLDLDEGWNLISVPVVQIDDSLASVLESIDGKWDYIQFYDASSPEPWKSNCTYKPSQLNSLDWLDHTMGIWINITEAGVQLRVRGDIPSSTAFNLKAGWNLVGYPSLTEKSIADALAGTGYDMPVEGFDGGAPYHINQLLDTYMMKPGEGYWVHVPADATWIVNW